MRRRCMQVARMAAHSSAVRPPGLSAAGGSVGGCGAAEALEGLVGERPVGRLLAGVAGGTAAGGDGHGSGRRRPGRAREDART